MLIAALDWRQIIVLFLRQLSLLRLVLLLNVLLLLQVIIILWLSATEAIELILLPLLTLSLDIIVVSEI